MSNEKIAIAGIIVIVASIIASVTATAINAVVDGNTYKDIIVIIGSGSITGLIGYIGGVAQEKIKHSKDIEIGQGKILDYNEKSENEGV